MSNARKNIVRTLDNAAARADDQGMTGASSKQTWFLAGLLADAGKDAGDVIDHTGILTSRDASAFIDLALKEKARAEMTAEQVAAEQAALEAARIARFQKEAAAQASEVARHQAQSDDTARIDAILVERGKGHLTGAKRREARRLIRRELEAQAA